jgi:hypothetical protein
MKPSSRNPTLIFNQSPAHQKLKRLVTNNQQQGSQRIFDNQRTLIEKISDSDRIYDC